MLSSFVAIDRDLRGWAWRRPSRAHICHTAVGVAAWRVGIFVTVARECISVELGVRVRREGGLFSCRFGNVRTEVRYRIIYTVRAGMSAGCDVFYGERFFFSALRIYEMKAGGKMGA